MLRTAKNVSLILSILSLVLITGCSEFPDVHPTILDTQLNEGRQYKIVNKADLTFEFEKIVPIQSMNGFICFSQQDYIAMRDFYIKNKDKCSQSK